MPLTPLYDRPPDIEAQVTFFSTEQSGRRLAASSGYHGHFYFEGEYFGSDHEYPDVVCVHPGESARVFIRFFAPDGLVGRLYPGAEFEIRETHTPLGRGTVKQILHLSESAERVRQWREGLESRS
jgi:translation elongation factor EF-Tu-like GTPase